MKPYAVRTSSLFAAAAAFVLLLLAVPRHAWAQG